MDSNWDGPSIWMTSCIEGVLPSHMAAHLFLCWKKLQHEFRVWLCLSTRHGSGSKDIEEIFCILVAPHTLYMSCSEDHMGDLIQDESTTELYQ